MVHVARLRGLLALGLALGWGVFLAMHPLGLVWCEADDHAGIETAGEGCCRPAPAPTPGDAGATPDTCHGCSDVAIGLLSDGHGKAPRLVLPAPVGGLAISPSGAAVEGRPDTGPVFPATGPPVSIPQRC